MKNGDSEGGRGDAVEVSEDEHFESDVYEGERDKGGVMGCEHVGGLGREAEGFVMRDRRACW